MDNILENDTENGKNLGTALQQALKEAVDDETFRKVKRMSYSSNAADEVSILKCINNAFALGYVPNVVLRSFVVHCQKQNA